jgi:hypothetical protein
MLNGKDEYRISNKEFRMMKFSVVSPPGYEVSSFKGSKRQNQSTFSQDQNPCSPSIFCGSLFDIRYSSSIAEAFSLLREVVALVGRLQNNKLKGLLTVVC